MKPHYSISIPKPCQEDWSKMTPYEKGRFCQSCSKTVVDFTKMPQKNIQNYMAVNSDKKICGRFKVSQLEEIRIQIPQQIVQQQMPFHKLFLLVLLITMGTSLLNCSDQNGNTKKIDVVEIVDTLKTKANNLPEVLNLKTNIDSVKINKKTVKPIKKNEVPTPVLTGLVIEVMGDIAIEPATPIDEVVFGFIHVDYSPEFSDTPISLSKSEKKKYFSKRITEFVSANFDSGQGYLGLKGKQRINTQFTIDKKGDVTNIKIRAPHPLLEKEAMRIIKLLPQFIPGQQSGKNVEVVYTLPIVFMIKD